MNDERNKILEEEANSFDNQIEERIDAGHTPDLRSKERCEYFYNNVWRDPVYANLHFGSTLEQILKNIKNHFKNKKDLNILEIACGPGHLTLELARHDFIVKGIDISSKCIEIASNFAKKDFEVNEKGNLSYEVKDAMKLDVNEKYDVVFFSRALHHFGNIEDILKKVSSILRARGLIHVTEPIRERIKESDAILVYLIRMLLSQGNRYYQEFEIPESEGEFKDALGKIRNEFDYKDDCGNNIQSPCDSEACFSDMYPALKKYFTEIEMKKEFSFFDKVVGGIRFDTVEQEHKMARWLFMVDKTLCESGTTSPEIFHFSGIKK